MSGQEGVIRFYGLRELATGIGIFAQKEDPAPWIWGAWPATRWTSPLARDYSDRVGFGGSPQSVWGAARKDFEMPRDMRHMPPGMRPTMH